MWGLSGMEDATFSFEEVEVPTLVRLWQGQTLFMGRGGHPNA